MPKFAPASFATTKAAPVSRSIGRASTIYERQALCLLEDPFAKQVGAWQKCPSNPRRRRPPTRSFLQGALAAYDLGQYELADARLREVESCLQLTGSRFPPEALRYRAWLQARRGFIDGPDILARLYGRETRNLLETNDY